MSTRIPFLAPFLMGDWTTNEEDREYISSCIGGDDSAAVEKFLCTPVAPIRLPAAPSLYDLDLIGMPALTSDEEEYLNDWVDPMDIVILLEKLGLVETPVVSPVVSPLALKPSRNFTFQNMAFSPRWLSGHETSFDNPLFGQEIETGVEVHPSSSPLCISFAARRSSGDSGVSSSSCSPASSPSSSPSSSAATSPAWSPVNSFVRRYDSATEADGFATAGSNLQPVPYTAFATAAGFAAAALADSVPAPTTVALSTTASVSLVTSRALLPALGASFDLPDGVSPSLWLAVHSAALVREPTPEDELRDARAWLEIRKLLAEAAVPREGTSDVIQESPSLLRFLAEARMEVDRLMMESLELVHEEAGAAAYDNINDADDEAFFREHSAAAVTP